MEKEKLMIELTINNKPIKYSPKTVETVHSTHYDQERRLYEIWDGEYFVIYKHSPWIMIHI